MTYTVVATSDNACSAVDTVRVTYEPGDLEFANFLSPDGDGKNDFFIIKNVELATENWIRIFNRWGDIVYEASPYRNDWDGTANTGAVLFGEALPEGSYFYVFKESPEADIVKGYIILKR